MNYLVGVFSFFVLWLLSSCHSFKIQGQGQLPTGERYRLNGVDFFSFKEDCNGFSGSILNNNKKIIETISYYTCAPLPPIKSLRRYDANGKHSGTTYFIAVVEGVAQYPTSPTEKELFALLDNKAFKKNYRNYQGIIGFRDTLSTDQLAAIPGLLRTR